ncbi:hypothetical protein QQF64_001245 [Cirrhinus molitorella]|uniref:Uncharacterized protein n=1 Tax=Cirrhinus molitorella TaxID=172907 RepID=A0ABR3P003_9TELE
MKLQTKWAFPGVSKSDNSHACTNAVNELLCFDSLRSHARIKVVLGEVRLSDTGFSLCQTNMELLYIHTRSGSTPSIRPAGRMSPEPAVCLLRHCRSRDMNSYH